jgi:hypothetical protein
MIYLHKIACSQKQMVDEGLAETAVIKRISQKALLDVLKLEFNVLWIQAECRAAALQDERLPQTLLRLCNLIDFCSHCFKQQDSVRGSVVRHWTGISPSLVMKL